MDNRSVFKDNLQRIMKENNKKPVDMVEALNIGFSTFMSWYNGVSFPRAEAMQRIANILGIEVHQLLIHPDDIVPINNVLKVPVYRSVSCGSPPTSLFPNFYITKGYLVATFKWSK